MPRRLPRSEHILLALLFLVLGWLKLQHGLDHWVDKPDSTYYLDIAQHLARGDGFVSDMSMLHAGVPTFPHPSPVYPAWPRLMGLLWNILPLDWLRFGLPNLLYFTSLLLAWRFGDGLVPKPLAQWKGVRFTAGHIFALIFGLHLTYFEATAEPLTEGLCYTLLFALLLRLRPFFARPSLLRGLEVGLWVALLFLTRTQMLIVLMALAPMLGWSLLVDRSLKRLAGVLGVALGFGALIGLQVRFLSTFVQPVTLGTFMSFHSFRPTEFLSPIPQVMVQTDGLWALLADRAQGFGVAFSWKGRWSYKVSYYLFQYGLPLAVGAGVVDIARKVRGPQLRAGWDWIRSPQALYPLFVAVFSLGGFFSIHALHKQHFSEWHFPMRYALTCAPLFAFALIYLMRRGGLTAALAGLLMLGSTGMGVYEIGEYLERHERKQRKYRKGYLPNLQDWLQERVDQDGGVVFAMYQGQKVTWMVDGAAFHWLWRGTTTQDLRAMIEELDVQYVMLSKWEVERRDFPFLAEGEPFFDDFEFCGLGIGLYSVYCPVEGRFRRE